jgi:hypothetical protein
MVNTDYVNVLGLKVVKETPICKFMGWRAIKVCGRDIKFR